MMLLIALLGLLSVAGAAVQKEPLERGGLSPAVRLPLVVNTWPGPFEEATAAAWQALQAGGSALDAIEQGCSRCEAAQCDRTVGFGGSPDEAGETSLDALVMDGSSMRAGAVSNLRRVKQAASAARLVMERTRHTMLAGEEATAFAADMGLAVEPTLATDESRAAWRRWTESKCQPNFRQRVSPDPSHSCGPYRPLAQRPASAASQPITGPGGSSSSSDGLTAALTEPEQLGELQHVRHTTPAGWPTPTNHDTIAMVVVSADGSVAAGSSSNGAVHKVPGRVGDASVPGGGAYADSEVGGCGATGDGDVHLSFLPCYQVVESMRRGMAPQEAAEDAVRRIARRIPGYTGAVVAVSRDGRHGGAAHGFTTFAYSVASAASSGRVETVPVPPLVVETAAVARNAAVQTRPGALDAQ